NPVTGKFEAPDSYFISEFESNVFINESPENFRSNLIARLGAYALDNPGKEIVYASIFSDLVNLLQESFRNEQKKVISKITSNLMLYLAELRENKSSGISKEVKGQIDSLIKNLIKKYNYSENGAITSLQYLLKM